MGQIKNIKLHIVTDIKAQVYLVNDYFIMVYRFILILRFAFMIIEASSIQSEFLPSAHDELQHTKRGKTYVLPNTTRSTLKFYRGNETFSIHLQWETYDSFAVDHYTIAYRLNQENQYRRDKYIIRANDTISARIHVVINDNETISQQKHANCYMIIHAQTPYSNNPPVFFSEIVPEYEIQVVLTIPPNRHTVDKRSVIIAAVSSTCVFVALASYISLKLYRRHQYRKNRTRSLP